MREVSDLLFFISLGLIALAFFAATLLGPRVIRGADGLPLDDNTEILARQDKGIKKVFRSWLLWIGVIGIISSVILSSI